MHIDNFHCFENARYMLECNNVMENKLHAGTYFLLTLPADIKKRKKQNEGDDILLLLKRNSLIINSENNITITDESGRQTETRFFLSHNDGLWAVLEN